jgi:hypothetical protein
MGVVLEGMFDAGETHSKIQSRFPSSHLVHFGPLFDASHYKSNQVRQLTEDSDKVINHNCSSNLKLTLVACRHCRVTGAGIRGYDCVRWVHFSGCECGKQGGGERPAVALRLDA